MNEYRVHFTQTFVAHGWRTVAASDETGAVDDVYRDLQDDPAYEEIDDANDIEVTEVEEV
jgi:hypothetical protein